MHCDALTPRGLGFIGVVSFHHIKGLREDTHLLDLVYKASASVPTNTGTIAVTGEAVIYDSNPYC